MLDFNLILKENEGVPVLNVDGEIDVYTSPKLHAELNGLMDKHPRGLILNLAKVHFIDSTGLGTIAHTAEALSAGGKKMTIVCPREQLRKVFDVSGLSRNIVSLFEEESEALGAL